MTHGFLVTSILESLIPQKSMHNRFNTMHSSQRSELHQYSDISSSPFRTVDVYIITADMWHITLGGTD